jgi:DNA-directed RNA polymerase subunit M/transcription elongation factor TFIIS
MTSSLSNQGISALKTVLTLKNAKSVEKRIVKSLEDFKNTDSFENLYKNALYQAIGDIINGKTIKDINKNIKNKKINWKHPVFSSITHKLDEHDEFITNPFEVEEGVTKCNKCGSRRVFTHQIIRRSCDEPMTTLAKCVKCKSTWTYSG